MDGTVPGKPWITKDAMMQYRDVLCILCCCDQNKKTFTALRETIWTGHLQAQRIMFSALHTEAGWILGTNDESYEVII